MKFFLYPAALLLILFLIGWLGLQVTPKPIKIPDLPSVTTGTYTLPDTIPDQAIQFYKQIYGQEIPIIKSAVISGNGSMNIKGINFPARFCFIHKSGESYRHYFELTLWGLTIMRVNEYYMDGEARLELPFGVVDHEPKVNQGANLALWAEALWYPSIYITDPRIEWANSHSNTASIYVPFGREHQELQIRFNDKTSLPDSMQAMRYKSPESSEKTLWIIEPSQWQDVEGHTIFKEAALTWRDEGKPWAKFSVDQITYNQDVSKLLVSKSAPFSH